MAARNSKPSTPPRGFTDKFLENIKPRQARYELADKGCPGLRLRVQPTGTLSFIWYRKNPATGKNQGIVLGSYPEMPLAAARKELAAEKKKHAAGDPVTEDAPKTVADLAERFYSIRIEPVLKRPDAVRQVLDHDIIPAIGQRKLAVVTPSMLGNVVHAAVKRGARSHAGRIMATLKQMFSWGRGTGLIHDNPAIDLKADNYGIVQAVRQHALDVDSDGKAQAKLVEIPALWRALDAYVGISIQVRNGVKILMLTGVRTGELRLAEWSEIDWDRKRWTIPVSHQKIKPKQLAKARPFVVPLTDQVIDLLHELKDATPSKSPYLLTGKPGEDGHRPMSDKALARAVRRMLPDMDIAPFRVHDLRRTMRSHLSGLGVQPHVAELCLNHSLGSIQETYDVTTYLDDRRDALEKWSARVDRAVNPVANVVEISA